MSTPPRWIPPPLHDPRSCQTCKDYVMSGAWKRGVAKAQAQTAKLTEGMDREDA